ncbi:hypothetical protein PWG14_22965 [Chromobacterium amazonense]|uniref:hypothetical protein n=1 Tax=Chromobacterium amazonense TaxID=1382803 RepID=UPI00237DE2D4|nr:hypothetical protein [Chromobacterium amazonense]MDE1715327.1 hypothetical protein [Chromobacterium amazonense]
MQIESGFLGVRAPDVKLAVREALDRLQAVGAMALRPVKELGSRLRAITRQPWFFPVQVAVILAVLWFQQHGYLQVPVTVCDWVRLGK